MKRQIKTTLLNYLKLGMLSCIVLPAYANNIPDNLSNWQPGASTKNGDSNATFSMAVLTEEGENYGSLFKSEQSLNVVGDIRVAPEHVGKNGKVFIVAQYNHQWFMKGANGWKPWDLQTKNLVARSASHPLLEVESPVIENGLSNLLGDFEIFLGYLVDDDLNYNKTPLKFAVKVLEATKAADLTIKSFAASKSTLKPSDKTKLLVNIKNIGDALAPNTQLYYYKRASNSNEGNSLNEGDKQECTQSLYQLPAGNSNDKYCQVDMPDTAGDYYYGVCVKAVEGETNLTNNCSSAIKITVKEPEVVTVSPPTSLIAQDALVVTGFGNITKVVTDVSFPQTATGGTNSSSGAIVYSSGNTAVATVNSSTGDVTLLTVGTAVITATKPADSTYLAQTATYNLAVNPVTPTGVAITPKNSKLTVSWTDSNSAVAGGYNVYVSSSASQANPLLTVPMISGTTADITGLLNSETYYVAVRKEVNGRESAVSNELSFTPNGTMGMNDTGITLTGSGGSCTGATPPEDCSTGRDAKASANTLDKLGGGQAGFDFTKLDQNGTALTTQNTAWNTSGAEVTFDQWSCVKDNVTGLVWEVKTDAGVMNTAGNIHHKDNTYQWGGTTAIGTGFGVYSTEWNGLVSGSNNATLCGFNSGWRVPTKSELASITQKGLVGGTAIDADYFPNAMPNVYWTASPAADNVTKAWGVLFSDGGDNWADRTTSSRVRLVH